MQDKTVIKTGITAQGSIEKDHPWSIIYDTFTKCLTVK